MSAPAIRAVERINWHRVSVAASEIVGVIAVGYVIFLCVIG